MKWVLILLLACSCSTLHRAEQIHTLEMNNLIERYSETIWNRENNLPGETEYYRYELKQAILRYYYGTDYIRFKAVNKHD
jgi:hypothetical protein